MTDDEPVYHTLSVHLFQAKLITRFDDRYAVAKFSKSVVEDKVPEGSAIIFGDNRISEVHMPKTSLIHSAVSIEQRLVTERQTQAHG